MEGFIMRYSTTACLCLILLLFAASGCASAPPKAKPSIPDDLLPVCYKGKLGVVSESAQEGLTWNLPCLDEKRVSR